MSNKTRGKNVQTKASESGDKQTKASDPVVEKKRKSIGGDAERSPLRVAAPVSVAVASSAPSAVVAVKAELPARSQIPKKDLKFRNHFPEGILKCRPGTEFSDDDDDESIAIKEVEIALVKEKNAAYFEQLDNEAEIGEDCRKADLDQSLRETEEAQEDLDEVQQVLKEAEARHKLQEERSEAIRAHEIALADKNSNP